MRKELAESNVIREELTSKNEELLVDNTKLT